jgi:hypothetical protein
MRPLSACGKEGPPKGGTTNKVGRFTYCSKCPWSPAGWHYDEILPLLGMHVRLTPAGVDDRHCCLARMSLAEALIA